MKRKTQKPKMSALERRLRGADPGRRLPGNGPMYSGGTMVMTPGELKAYVLRFALRTAQALKVEREAHRETARLLGRYAGRLGKAGLRLATKAEAAQG